MPETTEYAGTLELNENGKVVFPEKYQPPDDLIVRTPWHTEVFQGRNISWYRSDNDHLEDGEIEFELFGGDPEVYRVENYDG